MSTSSPPGAPARVRSTGPAEDASDLGVDADAERAAASGAGGTRWAWVGVLAALSWGCWSWRAELNAVPYLDDSSVHEQMVRFAVTRFEAGHLPLTSWFPYLGLGSPQFLHYQSLPAMLTGLLGMAVGGDAAFRISLYLLLALWPLPVYGAARVFGMTRVAAALAAAVSPFLMSVPGVGYEPKAYVWIGYGVWAQLWASWTLPLAWAFTWRAMSSRRAVVPAVVFVALTMACHFETGYLAGIPVVLFPFVAPGPWRTRAWRAVAVGGGAVLVSAWVTVPLVLQGKWAATNEVLAHTPLVNGYGAKQVTAWLVRGQVFDAYRFPVVTILAALGLVACLWRWRRVAWGRAVVVATAMSLVLCFGRTTFGPLTRIIPGSTDIFMRRFMMGVQLGGILLAGVGAVALVQLAQRGIDTRWPGALVRLRHPALRGPALAVAAGVTIGVLAPAWTQIGSYAAANAQAVGEQRAADATAGAQVGRLVAYVKAHGGGRVYAGMPSNWGSEFTVGAVPVFKYLESLDVDEVGYTLRTASLMTDPEYFFDEDDPGDYPLFAVRYMILPEGHPPPVQARLVEEAGPYLLWVLPQSGYLRVVDTVGVLTADRTNVGIMSVPYLRSDLPGQGRYLAVAWAGAAPAPLTATATTALVGSAGSVRDEVDDLPDGRVSATVVVRRTAAVVLSASFDPGWTAEVDGRRAPVQMLAPALPAVRIGPGVHVVTFVFAGFGAYPALFAVSGASLAGALWLGPFGGAAWLQERLGRRRDRRGRRIRTTTGAGDAA